MADPLLVAVLAAGRARRFGGKKLEADCAGKPVARWVLDTVAAAGLPAGIIVTGPAGARWANGAATGWNICINRHADEGIGTSIALAAGEALAQGVPRMLVLLGDMPLVEPAYLARLAACKTAAVTSYPNGKTGVPAVLDRLLMEQAAQLSGDTGAGFLLRSVLVMDAPDGSLADVDRPDDLARVAGLLHARDLL